VFKMCLHYGRQDFQKNSRKSSYFHVTPKHILNAGFELISKRRSFPFSYVGMGGVGGGGGGGGGGENRKIWKLPKEVLSEFEVNEKKDLKREVKLSKLSLKCDRKSDFSTLFFNIKYFPYNMKVRIGLLALL